jgi:flagellar hook-associated protein 3 FlgL
MRVTFNTNLADLLQAISVASSQMATAQLQVATGRRLNAASDDPTAAQAAVSEHSQMAATDQYQATADSVSSRLSVVDSALSTLINQATSAQSAVLSARTSTATSVQREAAASQLESIRASIVSLMNTRFQGAYLFSGNNPTVAPYTETNGTVSAYQGGSGTVNVDIDRQTAVQVGFSSDQILKGADSKDLIQVLTDLATAVRAGDDTAMQNGATALDSAFSRLTAAQTRVGNEMDQLTLCQQQLIVRHLSAQTRLSTLEDADLATAATEMNRASVAYQAALKATASATQPTLLDYLK